MDKAQPTSLAEHINTLAHDINQWARRKGFWNVPEELSAASLSTKTLEWLERLVKSQKMALVTTETSEAVEAIRKPTESGLPGFTNEEEEVADQIIRLLDYAAQYKLRIGEAIVAKMAVNEGRPYQHGKHF